MSNPSSMSLYQITNPADVTNGSASTEFTPACQTSPLCSHKVCDTSLSISERVASLVSELEFEEKILNLVDASAGSTRLGLPPYEWWSEATHGVGSAPGVQFTDMGMNFSYATSFPSPILSAAAFDDELIRSIGNVVGREGRAFGNYGFAGFDYWAPNMVSQLRKSICASAVSSIAMAVSRPWWYCRLPSCRARHCDSPQDASHVPPCSRSAR